MLMAHLEKYMEKFRIYVKGNNGTIKKRQAVNFLFKWRDFFSLNSGLGNHSLFNLN